MQRRSPYSSQSPAIADQNQARRIGEALQQRAAGFTRERDDVALAHEEFLGRLDRVGQRAPVVRTAWVLLDQHGIRPVPLDGDLEPAGDPLDTTDAVLDHYERNPRHGVGIATGKHPLRPWTYLAVKVDLFKSWAEWLREAAAVTEKVPDLGGFADIGGMAEIGPPREKTTRRDTGAFSRLLWVPPPLPQMKQWKMDATGGELAKRINAQKVGRGGWIWLAVPDTDGDVKVRKDRQVAPGIRVLATGTVIPWEGSRTADGWKLRLESAAASQGGLSPSRQPPAPWLVESLTNRSR